MPTDIVQDEWTYSSPSPVEHDLSTYWALLSDPLIDRNVSKALAGNRDLATARARIAQARAGLRSSRAGFSPQASGSGSLQQNIGANTTDDVIISTGVDLSWEADLFGRIGYDVSASEAQLQASGYSFEDVRRLIIGEVARQTVTARSIAAQLNIARQTLAIQDENLQIARWRREAGLVSSLDVEQARLQRAQTAASIPSLEQQLVATSNALSVLLGETPGRLRQEFAGSAPIPQPPGLVGFPVPAEVLRNRPDVRQAEAGLMADTARIGLARAQMLPLVQLRGSIDSSSVGIGSLFDIITGSLFSGVSQLIFDGGRSKAQVDSARAQAAVSLAGWEQAILQALQDVETSSSSMRTSRARIAELRIALDAANNASILARSQYRAGLVDFETLLNAESQLLSTRNSLISVQAERANAFINLAQALGGGWKDTQGIPIAPGSIVPAPNIPSPITPSAPEVEQ